MALKCDDLFRLEAAARLHADRLRKQVAADPGSSPALKLIDDAMLADAKGFDAIGDLLLGLQGCWEHHGGADLVRDGFKRMSRSYDLSKMYVLAVEAKVDPETAEVEAA